MQIQIPDQTLTQEAKEFFKLQLNNVLKAVEEKRKNLEDIESINSANEILESAENCVSGPFSSKIKGKEVKNLEDKIKKTHSHSKFITLIKQWANKFLALCKSPNSLSRRKNLEQITEVLVKGEPIKILNSKVIPNGMFDVQRELKEKLKSYKTDIEEVKKSKGIKRQNHVTELQKKQWEKKHSLTK